MWKRIQIVLALRMPKSPARVASRTCPIRTCISLLHVEHPWIQGADAADACFYATLTIIASDARPTLSKFPTRLNRAFHCITVFHLSWSQSNQSARVRSESGPLRWTPSHGRHCERALSLVPDYLRLETQYILEELSRSGACGGLCRTGNGSGHPAHLLNASPASSLTTDHAKNLQF